MVIYSIYLPILILKRRKWEEKQRERERERVDIGKWPMFLERKKEKRNITCVREGERRREIILYIEIWNSWNLKIYRNVESVFVCERKLN